MLRPGEGLLPFHPWGLSLRGRVSRIESDPLCEGISDVTVIPPDQLLFEGMVYGAFADKSIREVPVRLSVPDVDKDGFFHIGPTTYMIANVGLPSPWEPMKTSYWFLSKGQVLRRVLSEALADALAPLFFRRDWNQVHAETSLQSTLTGHPWVRQVHGRPEAHRDTVLVFPVKDGISTRPYEFPKELEFCLDPCSTSSGEKINEVYQLADGATIEDGRIIPGSSRLCAFTRSFAIAPELVPKRMYLLRSAGQNSLELRQRTPDLFGRETTVHSRVLRTAIFNMGVHTFEDLIAVGEDVELDATDTRRVMVWSKRPLELLVGQGDPIEPGMKLAKDGEKEDFAFAPNLPYPMGLDEVSVSSGWHLGEKMIRTCFTIRMHIPLGEGDKLTTNSACKGVVTRQKEMPILAGGETVQVCLSPPGVAKRGAIQVLYEMMLREHAQTCGYRVQRMRFHELLKCRGHEHGKPQEITYKGKTYQALVGDLAWIRQNKLALLLASSVGEERPLTAEGMPVNRAGLSGQMLDPSKGIVLLNKGMKNTLRGLLGEARGAAIMEGVVLALESMTEKAEHDGAARPCPDSALGDPDGGRAPEAEGHQAVA